MGVINKTTDEINTLLDKVEGMPEEGVTGKTPVLETGETTTLPSGSQATSQVVANGVDAEGNPKYKLNFGIPRGADGSGSGGGVADSVEWSKVLNKPTWVNSTTKPSYTATEVGALPASTTIPSRTSQLTNDSNFTTTASFKTINGKSIVGSGNIVISGGSGGGIEEAPSDGKTYSRKNGGWVVSGFDSADITDLWTRITQIGEVGGTISQEDYGTLIQYATNATEVYLKNEDSYTPMTLMFLGNVIYLGWTIPTAGMGLISASVMINPDRTVKQGQSNIPSDNAISQAAILNGYSKPSAYSAITTEDTINMAIGKLEAGIGSGGGSSNNEFIIENSSIMNIKATDAVEKLNEYLGGEDNIQNIVNAIKENKKIYFKKDATIASYLLSAQSIYNFGAAYLMIDIPLDSSIDGNVNCKSVCLKLRSSPTIKYFNYVRGYTLNSGIDTLDTSSTDAEIKAVLPVSSLPELLALSKLGCRFRMPITQGYLSGGTIDAMFTIAKDESTQDYVIQISGAAYGLYGNASFGSRIISYEASSNTYSVVS